MASSVSWKGISRARAEGVAVSDDKSACGFDFLHDFVSVLLLALGLCSVIVKHSYVQMRAELFANTTDGTESRSRAAIPPIERVGTP